MKINSVYILAFDFWTSEELWLSLKNEATIILGLSLPCTSNHQASAEITKSFLCMKNARSGSKEMFGQSHCETLLVF